MTAEELRELAAALDVQYSSSDTDRAAAYLRACADALDAGPVMWRVRSRGQFKRFSQGPWRVFHGPEKPPTNCPEDCDFDPLYPLAMPGTLRLPEPMTDAEIMELYRAVPKGYLSRDGHAGIRVARATEAEVLRRVKEVNK